MNRSRAGYDRLELHRQPTEWVEIRVVDERILEQFDPALSEHAASVREGLLHPGLDPGDVERRLTTAGLLPSPEAVEWWSYYRLARDEHAELRDILPDFQFMSVDESVIKYRAVTLSLTVLTARLLRPRYESSTPTHRSNRIMVV